jgi:hypothetical protein
MTAAALTSSEDDAKGSPWSTPRDRASLRRLNIACLCWAIAFLGATLLLDGHALEGPAAWLAAAAPGGLATIVVLRYVRFLDVADELLRQIHLDALAIGFGAGFVFMTTYRLLERTGAPQLDINDSLLVMVACWGIGMWRAKRRYS